MELHQFDKVVAAFHPKRQDDLKPESVAHIGLVTEWKAMWIIEPGENQFEGQWAMMPLGKDDHWTGWVPLEDLEIINATS